MTINELILKPTDCILFQQRFLIVTDPVQENPKVVCINYETEDMTFVLEDLACPFGLCQSGNDVFLSDQGKRTMFKLNFEEHNKELLIGKKDAAGFGDGLTKEARIDLPCGICNRGMVLYINEHPENKQGGVSVYSSLSGLISFKSAWCDIALCFGNNSKRERLAEKIDKKVICSKEMMLQKELKHGKQYPYPWRG